MLAEITRRRYLVLWQALLILLGTAWLWAPHLNHGLSSRITLISQYEATAQPYSWLFRSGDFLSGGLVLGLGWLLQKRGAPRRIALLVIVAGCGLLVDPLLPTTCRQVSTTCQEYFSLSFLLHAIETVITAAALFLLSIYNALERKRLVSYLFVGFQIAYGLLFITQLANQGRFNTLSQFVYQTAIIVWLAWVGRDYIKPGNFRPSQKELKAIKNLAAGWAFLNGILAILISLAHIHLLGKIRPLYFAGDSAWLAQHGMIIGVAMLYLSRHLARGELRARQIFLAISAIETIKYSVISPNAGLMALYLLTFVAFFIFRDDFDRGIIPLTWSVRLKDFYFMVSALLVAILVTVLALDQDSRASIAASRTIDNFSDYVTRSGNYNHSHLMSLLLADTISAFIAAAIATLLWILFRPYKRHLGNSGRDYQRVESVLRKHSNSTEDYFKLWPRDKDYFWQSYGGGFVAYKLIGPIVFALADPISDQKAKLLAEFSAWSKIRRLRPCFLPIYEHNLLLYQEAGLQTMQIGSSAVIDIRTFLEETAQDKWWRWQKNRAAKIGYLYEVSQPPHTRSLIREIRTVSDSWLKKAGRIERGFALGYFDVSYLQNCQIHFLRDQAGKVVAFTNQLPQLIPSTTATIDLIRYLPEANNTMPYLLFKMIEDISIKDPSCKLFDLGFVPFARARGPLLAIAKTFSAGRFSSRGLEQFKNKFKPDWRPNYMAYEGDLADLALVALNLEKAMEQEK
jgi:lysylphosphatidylglycerol synthetase-like protein (DUF2156 family)